MKHHSCGLTGIIFLVLGIAISCKKEESQSPVSQQQVPAPQYYTYLKAGNRWVYDMKISQQVMDSFTREVISCDSLGIYTLEMKDSHTSKKEYLFKSGNQLFGFTQGEQAGDAVLYLQDPLKAGEQWQKKSGNDTIEVTVKELEQAIQTPLGNLVCSCLEEKNIRTGEWLMRWQHKEFGLVQMQFSYGGQIITYTLRGKNF